MQIWNDMMVSKRLQNVYFGVNYRFNAAFDSFILIIILINISTINILYRLKSWVGFLETDLS